MDQIPFVSLTGYVYDETLHEEANAHGQNYWYKYIEEMFDEIGLRAAKLSPQHLLDPTLLSGLKFVFVGDFSLSLEAQKSLSEWVAQGGVLIGFVTKDADELFGIRRKQTLRQADDEYTVSAYYRFDNSGDGNADPLYGYKGAKLPILSDVELVEATDGGKLGTLFNAAQWNTGYDAIVRRSVGEGTTYYFAFHLPQTLWAMHQGRPVVRDVDGDGFYRVGDSIALGRVIDLDLPYADYWLQFMEELLVQAPQPFIHQLPPFPDGTAPDMLLHYGGDDECTSGIQVKASHYMKEKGLAYHMNLMPTQEGKFAISAEEYAEIKRNGHDLSLHFDFARPHYHFTEADIKEQTDQYIAAFGETPIATVNHCATFTGWTEQARWASSCGMKGDNTRIHAFTPPYNPINILGFGFGTVYPHFVYDDFRHNNGKIPYAYIPIVLYEPRIYEGSRDEDLRRIHSALDRANHFRWSLNIFLHPVYIADDAWNANCLPAIEEILRYLEEKQYRAMHFSTNQLCLWWFDRSETIVEHRGIHKSDDGKEVSVSFTVKTPSSNGVLIKIPLPDPSAEPLIYCLDGEWRPCTIQRQNGTNRAVCYVPYGEHQVELICGK